MAENFWKSQREKIDKTQFEIAIALGCQPATVSAWECDVNLPKVRNAERIAEVYQVTEKRVIEAIVEQSKRMTVASR